MKTVFEIGHAMGTTLDKRWTRHGRTLDSLPDLALEVIARFEPSHTITLEQVARDVSAIAGDLPRQHGAGNAHFGQPPLTLYHHPADGFFIELYLWSCVDMTIHDHPFTGAFTVLAGECQNDTFEFSQEQVFDDLEVGALTQTRSETLGPGASLPITNERSFIHRNLHLGTPSMTLVVRTLWDGCRGLIYDEAGFAVDPGMTPAAWKQLQFLEGLLRFDVEAARRYLLGLLADPHSAALLYYAVGVYVSTTKKFDELDELVERSRVFLGDGADRVRVAFAPQTDLES